MARVVTSGRSPPILAFIGVAAWAAVAAAGEPADRGISLTAWIGGAIDRSITAVDGGHRVNDATPIFGATTVGNIERVAMGGSLDATPGSLGNGRLSLGGLLGYQQQVGRTRLHAFGEAGQRRFSQVGGTMFGHQVGADARLPYAGVRLGAARTIPAHGFVEVGLSLFARYDFGQATVTNRGSVMGEETRTDYRLGGLTMALTLEVGIRLEAPHPWNQGVVEP